MIRRIAAREFLDVARDGRLRVIAGLLVALLVAAAAVGSIEARRVAADRTAAAKTTRTQWNDQPSRNPHGAAHFGMYAVRPAGPLTAVDRGLDRYLGTAVYMEAHYQNPVRYRPAEDGTAVDRMAELTVAGILQLLIPLLIVLLTFGAFAGEREAGTLRQLLSLGVPRRAFLVGKALGIAAVLAVVAVPAALVGALALSVSVDASGLAHVGTRSVLMAGGYVLYYVACLGLGLAVSAIAPSSRVALLVLTGWWAVTGFVVPVIASDLAERLYPTPTASEFWHAVKQDLDRGVDGHNPRTARYDAFKQQVLARYGVSRVEDLPVNFTGLAYLESERYGDMVFDRHYSRLADRYAQQQRVHDVLAIVAPVIAIRSWSTAMAGSDLAHHRGFAQAAEAFRRRLNRLLNEDLAYKGARPGLYMADTSLWRRVPRFEYETPDAWWAAGERQASLLLLGGWALAAVILAGAGARRLTP
jgi:ABC-2 type transport system permease protein